MNAKPEVKNVYRTLTPKSAVKLQLIRILKDKPFKI